MKIPKKIRVGGIDYKIIIKERFKDDADTWGGCKNDLAKIELVTMNDSKKLANCIFLSNLFHELCHAIDGVYCGQSMSENVIEKIETFWFQILSDNNLFIGKEGLPNKIRIQGRSYKVITNHKFDCVDGNPSVSISLSDLKIKCVGGINKEVLKRNLIVCIMMHIVGSNLFSDEERNEILIESFCSGLYQVLKDTKLNDLIRGIC